MATDEDDERTFSFKVGGISRPPRETRTPEDDSGLPEQSPSTTETDDASESSPIRVVPGSSQTDISRQRERSRQAQRRSKSSKQDKKTLQEKAVAASQRPGFAAWAYTVLLVDGLVVYASVSWLKGHTMLIVLGVLTVCNLLVATKTLGSAYKPPAEVPEGALLPTEGLPKYIYKVSRLYGRQNKVPKLTKEQQLYEETSLLKKRLRELYLYVQPTIWIGNEKGNSAKTTLTVGGGNLIADTLRRKVLLLFTSANTTTGTASKLAGLVKKTLTVRQLSRRLGGIETPRDLFSQVNNTEHGLYVVGEDSGGSTRDGYFQADRYGKIFQKAYEESELLLLDTGNDGAHVGSVTVFGLQRADVPIFTAYVGVGGEPGLDKLSETIADYIDYAQENGEADAKPLGRRRVGSDIPLIEKCLGGVVVFNGLKPDQDLEDYRQYIGNPDFKGAILGTHWDDYLSTVTKKFEPELMAARTTRDYFLVYVAAFEQAAKLLGVEIPERHPAIRDIGLTISAIPAAD
jgi:hypothetical protein